MQMVGRIRPAGEILSKVVVRQEGVALANGQLWKAFHICPYGMCIVMEG